MKIVVDDKIPYIQGVFEPYAEVVYAPGAMIDTAMVKDADALIIRTRTKCNRELLDGSNVKIIATATIGFDHIDRSYCDDHGIVWQNAPGCNSWSVAQYMAAMFALLYLEKGIDVKGLTLGVVGVGNVGRKVSKYASLLGMKVLLNDPPLEREGVDMDFVSLDKIKSESDIITFHVPLSMDGDDATFHMVDTKFLLECEKKPILCNTCRGEVFDTEVLKQVFDREQLSWLVVDCWEHEPDIDRVLLKEVWVTTPHIAGYSRDGKAMGTAMSVATISSYFNLPIKDWWPETIEVPQQVDIDLRGLDSRKALWLAISHTYRMVDEIELLKNSPETFEQQRGSYPLRREFPAYRVISEDLSVVKILKEMNFQVAEL
ncbi:4-phosphoerythronate dehydrogenase [Halosquirtibacter xylanolyticus]|uniref:4-phosphoerythronate dehydrogenase n=1 Tax=Halosquirtibacter xylanolyticus TaxID=3374599 RepID=UPI003748C0C8|nr:4-phosphoerythronate dehydrogenase [Prolixibacteraceae bacterium]